MTFSTLIRQGIDAPANVLAIQRRLNALGCGPVDEDGVYGKQTTAAIRLFQARFTDRDGLPLKIDGTVGQLTWNALFGIAAPAAAEAAGLDPFLGKVLAIAASQVGVMEQPPGSNSGPEVDQYLKSVGLAPSGNYPWCAAFVYWCFQQAAGQDGIANPAVRTGGVMDHWRKAGTRGTRRITAAEAKQDGGLVQGGHLFVISTGAGNGHIGFVESAGGGKLITIEGNTNDGGSREGIGVFRREKRKIADINMGFIDYGA
jgi:hypothetical protein